MTEELLAEISILKEKLKTVEAERNAAIKDLRSISSCPTCKAFHENLNEQCMNCSISDSKWEWFRTIS